MEFEVDGIIQILRYNCIIGSWSSWIPYAKFRINTIFHHMTENTILNIRWDY